MAKQTAKSTSGILQKLGVAGQKAFNAHKADETKFGSGGDLPGGIEGGVAQLTMCKFGEYGKGDQKGELYFMASATVVAPVTHENLHIEGLRTQIGPEPICATPTKSRQSIEDHMAWILNELRKLGVPTSELDDVNNLEVVAATLQEEKPYLRFRTWKGEPTKEYPNPRVNHEWRGVIEDYEPENGDGVVDNTETTAPVASKTSKTKAVVEEPAEDLEALGKAADSNDEDAQARLKGMADAAGIDADELATWAEVVTALGESTSAEESGAETETEGEDPVKGQIHFYKPPKAKAPIECEVTAVFEKARKVNLKNLDTKMVYKSVDWDALLESAE